MNTDSVYHAPISLTIYTFLRYMIEVLITTEDTLEVLS